MLVCPYCGERVQIEYDAALTRGYCATCGRLFPVEGRDATDGLARRGHLRGDGHHALVLDR